MSLNKSFLRSLFIVFCIITMVPTPAKATDISTDEATKFIEQMSNAAIQVANKHNTNFAALQKNLRTILVKNFDINNTAQFALGPYWKKATDAQRNEYQKLFEDMVVLTYAKRFSDYKGEKLLVKSARVKGAVAMVRSEVSNPGGGNNIVIDWRVKKTDSGLKVVDVVVEGASLRTTQRSEFATVIQRNGGDINDLIKTIRNRNKELANS